MRDHLGVGVLRHQLEQPALGERLVDDARALPQHEVRAVGLLHHERAEMAVGGEHDLLSLPSACTIFTAFDDVQITSDSAFTSAEQLM